MLNPSSRGASNPDMWLTFNFLFDDYVKQTIRVGGQLATLSLCRQTKPNGVILRAETTHMYPSLIWLIYINKLNLPQ